MDEKLQCGTQVLLLFHILPTLYHVGRLAPLGGQALHMQFESEGKFSQHPWHRNPACSEGVPSQVPKQLPSHSRIEKATLFRSP